MLARGCCCCRLWRFANFVNCLLLAFYRCLINPPRNIHLYIHTEIIWYELLIIAINIFRSTIMLMTLYDPNINNAQKRVKLLIPCNSNAIKSTRPNDAQNRDWDVSNKLQMKKSNRNDNYSNWFRVHLVYIDVWTLITLQSAAKCRKLFHYCQNPEYQHENDSIFSFPNPHNTIAIDLNRNQMQTIPMYKWKKIWWCR